jgi:hypothetical protein
VARYVTQEAIKWSLSQLKELPKNQTALIYFLIFGKQPIVDRGHAFSPFEVEFYKYFGAPIKGDGVAVYDPFSGEWRAENYINSTVYGRLLVGGHRWTEGEESYFSREPAGSGWPAEFKLTEKGFDNLLYRSSPPCLKRQYKLPLSAMAVFYYRQEPQPDSSSSIDSLVEKYKSDVISKNKVLQKLFCSGLGFPDDQLFGATKLSPSEYRACYPKSPYTSKELSTVRLYKEDVLEIRKNLREGHTVADYISDKIKN